MTEDLLGLLASPVAHRTLRVFGQSADTLIDEAGNKFGITRGIPRLIPLGPLEAFSSSLAAESEYYDSNESYGETILDHSRQILLSLHMDPSVGQVPVDATMEFSAQRAALDALGSMKEKTVAQIGGAGLHAIKMLLSGAARAVTITPFLQEAVVANQLAAEFGQGSKHLAVVGLGEALPLATSSFDAIYLGGSLHHLDTGAAAHEMARVLVPGGAFGAVDPWRTGIHGLGTRLLGKREKDVHCIPMSRERIEQMTHHFDDLTAQRFHPFTRYPLILLTSRLPQLVSDRHAARILSAETQLERNLPRFLRDRGSCVAVIGRKETALH